MANVESLGNLDFFNIGRYFRIGRNLLVGDPQYTKVLKMPFDPYQSDRLKRSFQQVYGFRGEKLTHVLGAGYSISELKKFGAA